MSIKANELRIGNFIEYDGRIFQIDTISNEFPTLNTDEFGIGVVDWNNIQPIPLTEEWLLNFGFGIDEEYDNTFIDNTSLKNEIIRVSIDSHYFTIDLFCGQVLEIPNIKYVHQLQNLYFALTGEELTIKL